MRRLTALASLAFLVPVLPCCAQEEQPLTDLAIAVATEVSGALAKEQGSGRMLIVPGCKVLRLPVEPLIELPITVDWGERVAASLRKALDHAVPKLHIIAESELRAFFEQQDLHPSDLCYEATAKWAAKRLEADLVVFSVFGESEGNDTLRCWILRAEDGRRIAVQATSFPKNEALRQPTAGYPQLGLVRGCSDKNMPRAGKDGVGVPTCIYCPLPPFTDAAVAAHYQGEIILCVTVETDGRTANVVPLKGAPFGLTASAMRAVSGWKLEPAKDSSEQPVSVRVMITTAFKQY